jgi:glycine/D-amino acid oxidase-like deaminating enzyme
MLGAMPTDTAVDRYRRLSLWLDDVGDELHPRPALGGDLDVDVAIVGAGYTGLWAAYYLLRADPHLRVALLEKEITGFGASGRNGGWCSALFAAPHGKIAKRYGRAAAIAMQKAMFETVDEVGRVVESERIEADFHKGGTLTLVTSPTQLERVRSEVDDDRSWGFGEDDFRWLDRLEVEERVKVAGVLGARFTPHCARVHPARLVRGLATTVERLGGTIYEQTPATSIAPRLVSTPRGRVRAEVVVRATEGYTCTLPGMRRDLLPLYSLMIATEPLSTDVWNEIGWDGCETLHDGRHLLIYAQRTPDDRIAIGGRGAPYHFGSRVGDLNDRDPRVFSSLKEVLGQLFPPARRAAITHEWGGCLGVPRDWFSSVGFEPATGLAWAGGYVGDGVSTSNLAGRCLRDLILGRDDELLKLPWVNHRSRRWEPEPFRWLGVNLGLRTMAGADRAEERSGKPTKRGELVKRLIGI